MKYSNGKQTIEAVRFTGTQSARNIGRMIGGMCEVRLNGNLYVGSTEVRRGQWVAMRHKPGCLLGYPVALDTLPTGFQPLFA